MEIQKINVGKVRTAHYSFYRRHFSVKGQCNTPELRGELINWYEKRVGLHFWYQLTSFFSGYPLWCIHIPLLSLHWQTPIWDMGAMTSKGLKFNFTLLKAVVTDGPISLLQKEAFRHNGIQQSGLVVIVSQWVREGERWQQRHTSQAGPDTALIINTNIQASTLPGCSIFSKRSLRITATRIFFSSLTYMDWFGKILTYSLLIVYVCAFLCFYTDDSLEMH